MTADVPAGERQALYSSRSCLFVTTRILVVDQLSGRINGSQIAGIVVLNAHRCGMVGRIAGAAVLCAAHHVPQRHAVCLPGAAVQLPLIPHGLRPSLRPISFL